MSSHRRPQDAWRKGPSGPAAGRNAAGRTPAGTPSGRGRWLKAGLVLAGLAGAVAALFVFLWPEPEPIVLALPVVEYTHEDWPPNPWAEADTRGFRDRFAGASAQAFQDQERDKLVRAIETAVDTAGRGRQPLVVYVCALGTVHAGTPYLLPADARPDDPGTWLTLDDVLAPLRRGTSRRMLILDVRPCNAPRAVLPTGDVGEQVDAALTRMAAAGDLPFPVLHAHTPPDGPAVVGPHGGTVFGRAVARGVGGAADGWLPDRSKDDSVSALELAAYVREATHAVNGSFGGFAHLPRVHGSGPDFRLLGVRKADPPPAEPAPPPDDPKWLADAWQDRDKAVAGGLHRRAPRLVRQLSLTALRGESRWRAGYPPDAIQARYLPTLTSLKQAEAAFPEFVPPAHSIARSRRLTPDFDKHEKAATGLLRSVFTLLRSADFAKADPDKRQAMAKGEWAKVVFPPELPPAAVAAAVWAFAREDPTVDSIRAVDAILDELPTRPLPAEFVGVRVIAATQKARADRWGTYAAGAVPAILAAFDEGEKAADVDGRAWPLIADRLVRADQTRRDALVALGKPDVPDADMAPAVDRLIGVRKSYGEIRSVGGEATTGWRHAGEARAALSDLADHYPYDLPAVAASKESSLGELADAYRELTARLQPAAGSPPADADSLGRAYRRVDRELDGLRSRIALSGRSAPRELAAALGWTGWPADKRLKLVDEWRAASAAAGDTGWPAAPSGREPATPPARTAEVFDASLRDLRNRLDLLALVAPDRVTKLRDDLANALRPGETGAAGRFSAVADAARTELRSALETRYDADPARRPDVGWAVDPDDVTAAEPTARANPEWFHRRDAERAFHQALAVGRYQADGKAMDAFTPAAADRSRAVAADLMNRLPN